MHFTKLLKNLRSIMMEYSVSLKEAIYILSHKITLTCKDSISIYPLVFNPKFDQMFSKSDNKDLIIINLIIEKYKTNNKCKNLIDEYSCYIDSIEIFNMEELIDDILETLPEQARILSEICDLL